MAGKIRGLIGRAASRIGQLLRGKPAPAQVRPSLIGPRGIAVGSTAERKRRLAAGLPEFTAEEIQQWRTLSPAEVDGFLDGMEPLFVHSSNVAMAQYFPAEQKLMLEFHGGAAYLYSNVSRQEAQEFVSAQSKGGWTWDRLRVRGTKKGHKKPYVRIR